MESEVVTRREEVYAHDDHTENEGNYTYVVESVGMAKRKQSMFCSTADSLNGNGSRA